MPQGKLKQKTKVPNAVKAKKKGSAFTTRARKWQCCLKWKYWSKIKNPHSLQALPFNRRNINLLSNRNWNKLCPSQWTNRLNRKWEAGQRRDKLIWAKHNRRSLNIIKRRAMRWRQKVQQWNDGLCVWLLLLKWISIKKDIFPKNLELFHLLFPTWTLISDEDWLMWDITQLIWCHKNLCLFH